MHPHALPHPVIGFYVRAESPLEAKAAALSLWRLASSGLVQLQGWEPLPAEDPFFGPGLETGAP
ncbi:hypothetical protein ACFSJS_25030 [Streptomyces desertarenae]|uniref:Uncharacterized protein n=1 Tax=Streptomyces desertarenae TaxID=2666184 RepID=A0ABW4PRQ9_9ACTN